MSFGMSHSDSRCHPRFRPKSPDRSEDSGDKRSRFGGEDFTCLLKVSSTLSDENADFTQCAHVASSSSARLAVRYGGYIRPTSSHNSREPPLRPNRPRDPQHLQASRQVGPCRRRPETLLTREQDQPGIEIAPSEPGHFRQPPPIACGLTRVLTSRHFVLKAEQEAGTKLPLITGDAGIVEAGGLMYYSVDLASAWRRSATYVD